MESSPTDGWYPDPDHVHQLRYHDGNDWTVHVADDGNMTQAPRSMAQPGGAGPLPSAADHFGDTGTEWRAGLARQYGLACAAVLDAARAALAVANDVSGAWNMANQRPQHELSIQSFTNFARGKEAEFAPLYRAFQQAAASAREAGGRLSAQFAKSEDAEICLLVNIGMDDYSMVGAVIEYLRLNFPPTALDFREMIPQVNQAIQTSPGFGEPGFAGNIYSDAHHTNRL
jgi:Protein of unknown function (DUF2510)